MTRKLISREQGEQYLAALPESLPMAVRFLLQELQLEHAGGTVELRVPPYGAIQVIGGLNHRRGTPPNVVEMDPESFIGLALGTISWSELQEGGKLGASGSRADELRNLFPFTAVR